MRQEFSSRLHLRRKRRRMNTDFTDKKLKKSVFICVNP